jgi:hypothetical protein
MKKLLIPFFITGTIVMIIVMGKTGKPLKTITTPGGIVNLELAYNTVKTNTVFRAWHINTAESKIEAAKTNTYWDFLFIFFYAGLLFLSCNKLSTMYKPGVGFNKAGKLIAKLAIIAGVLDVMENICMLQSLSGNINNAFALMAAVCATLKFMFLIMAVLYILGSLPVLIKYRKQPMP